MVSFNAGSQVPKPDVEGDTENIYTVKPIERLQEARDRIKALLKEKPLRVGVIGGGPLVCGDRRERLAALYEIREKFRRDYGLCR